MSDTFLGRKREYKENFGLQMWSGFAEMTFEHRFNFEIPDRHQRHVQI